MLRINPKLLKTPPTLTSKASLYGLNRRNLFTKNQPLTFYERSRDLAILSLSVVGLGVGYTYLKDNQASIHSKLIIPLLHLFFDGEESHKISILAAKYGLAPKEVLKDVDLDRLKVKIFDKLVENPIGLAAGYDKDGEVIDPMFDLGFGVVEVGSITPLPQEGNPKPRVFRLSEDKAIINRYGFNSLGHESALIRLMERQWTLIKSKFPTLDSETKSLVDNKLLGINLGKNKTSKMEDNQDYLKGIETFHHLADYLVVNISSPNTPNLRELQKGEFFNDLIKQVVQKRDSTDTKPPLLVKITSDLTSVELDQLCKVINQHDVDGIIVANTTISRPSTLKTGTTNPKLVAELGGLSGPPLYPKTLQTVRQVYKLTGGKKLIVACGGIQDAQQCIELAENGATFVQLYTSLAYKGPGLPTQIKLELNKILEKRNLSWMDIVGSKV